MPDLIPDDPIGAREARTIRDERIADLVAWLAADDARRAVLRECAMRLGMPAGRRWPEIPDDDVARLYRAVFAGDFKTDAEFDSSIPF